MTERIRVISEKRTYDYAIVHSKEKTIEKLHSLIGINLRVTSSDFEWLGEEMIEDLNCYIEELEDEHSGFKINWYLADVGQEIRVSVHYMENVVAYKQVRVNE